MDNCSFWFISAPIKNLFMERSFSQPINLPLQVIKCIARLRTTLNRLRSLKSNFECCLASNILLALLIPMPGTLTKSSSGALLISTGKSPKFLNAHAHLGS